MGRVAFQGAGGCPPKGGWRGYRRVGGWAGAPTHPWQVAWWVGGSQEAEEDRKEPSQRCEIWKSRQRCRFRRWHCLQIGASSAYRRDIGHPWRLARIISCCRRRRFFLAGASAQVWVRGWVVMSVGSAGGGWVGAAYPTHPLEGIPQPLEKRPTRKMTLSPPAGGAYGWRRPPENLFRAARDGACGGPSYGRKSHLPHFFRAYGAITPAAGRKGRPTVGNAWPTAANPKWRATSNI